MVDDSALKNVKSYIQIIIDDELKHSSTSNGDDHGIDDLRRAISYDDNDVAHNNPSAIQTVDDLIEAEDALIHRVKTDRRKELLLLPASDIVRWAEGLLDRDREFSMENSLADIPYWLSKERWTPEEVVALSFSKDPRIVNEKKLRAYPHSPFANRFFDRMAELNRAVRLGWLHEPIDRNALEKGASRLSFECPLLTSSNTNEPEEKVDVDFVHHRTKRFIQDALFAMAFENYGYTPGAAENGQCYSRIEHILKKFGLSGSYSSVENHLKDTFERIVSEKTYRGALKSKIEAMQAEKLASARPAHKRS